MVRYFVINMDKDIDRYKKLQKQFPHIKLERIQGVDIKKMSDKEKRDATTEIMYKFGTDGIIGCFLAHKNVWKKIVNENIDYAVVFEDDVNIESDIKDTVNDIVKKQYNFDILLLGCLSGCKDPKKYSIFDMMERTLIHGKSSPTFKNIDENVIQPEYFSGTHAYIVSNSGAKNLLKEFPKVTFHVDHAISDNNNIKKLSLKKYKVFQNNDLESNNIGFTSYLSDRLLFDHISIGISKPLSWALNIPVGRFYNAKINPRNIIFILLMIMSVIFMSNKREISSIACLLTGIFLIIKS